MTTIATCLSVDEALQLKMVLEAAGIPAFIPDETTAALAPHYFYTPTGVRLQVADADAADAREILEASAPEAPSQES